MSSRTVAATDLVITQMTVLAVSVSLSSIGAAFE